METEGVAEQRCPMCGRPNPPEAEECQHCGARLTPVTAGGAPQVPGARSGRGAGEEPAGGQDWLQRIRQQSESAGEPEFPEPGESDFAAELGGADLPSWLEQIEPDEVPGEAGPGEPEASPLRSAGEPAGAEGLAPAEAPEWLRRIRAREEERAQTADEAEEGWLSRLRGSPEAEAQRPAIPREPEAVSPGQPAERPAGPVRPSAAEQPPERPAGPPRRSAAEQPPERPAGPRRSGSTAEAMPSWLRDVEGREPEAAQEASTPRAGTGEGRSKTPSKTPPFGLPKVPALLGEEGAAPPAPTPPPPGEDVDLPQWLGEVSLEDKPESLPAAAEGEDMRLAPATLPSWLEAMRPVETFRPVVQIQSEDDQAVESAGPLAGLRGVLIAEPLVAMPRTATVGSMQLAVSERQYAQAELLHRMVEDEQREVHVTRKARPQLSLIRWIAAGVLLFATALPVLSGAPRFPLPSLEPRELGSLFSLIDTLPAERPALLVFDYEPGYSGELEAVGEALIEQIMLRQIPIATMTTRPTGSPLATRVIGRLAAQHDYVAGEDLVHLGYLSGGATAIQLFSLRPREAILRGFDLPEALQESGTSAWDTPVLGQVDSLSDFGVVTVITAGTETARAWAEQAKNSMGETPLVMVLSAGAEPMVRPYYEAREPRVNGILTGLPAATAYERRMSRDGLAAQRWNAFGTAMLASELILAAGIAFGALQWWRTRQAK